VRHEDRTAGELEERREDLVDRRLGRHRAVIDAGQMRDERGDRRLGVDQGLERSEALAASTLHRTDLRDTAIARRAAGGLEIHDAERHVGEPNPLVERGLDRCREHERLRPVVPSGRATISNRCSVVKHIPPR
jgi:hypothetical protein